MPEGEGPSLLAGHALNAPGLGVGQGAGQPLSWLTCIFLL